MSAIAKPISDLTPNNSTVPEHGVSLGGVFRVWLRIALPLIFGAAP
jgi:hypothetical protein